MNDRPESDSVAIGEERLFVEKQLRDGDRVRVQTHVDVHDEVLTAFVRSEEVTVERIPIDREVRSFPEVRREGNVLIVPVAEEEVVITKRLILKEELHIVRTVSEQRVEQTVPVRRMRAVVERQGPQEGAHEQPQEAPSGPDDHSSLRHQGTRRGGETGDPRPGD